MGDDRYPRGASFFARDEGPAPHRHRAEYVEEVARGLGHVHPGGRTLVGEIPRLPVHRHQLVERRQPLAPVRDIRAGVASLVEVDESIGCRVGKTAQEDHVHHAEDRSARPDPERENGNSHHGKPRLAPERAEGESDVLPDGLHRPPPRGPGRSRDRSRLQPLREAGGNAPDDRPQHHPRAARDAAADRLPVLIEKHLARVRPVPPPEFGWKRAEHEMIDREGESLTGHPTGPGHAGRPDRVINLRDLARSVSWASRAASAATTRRPNSVIA